MTRLPRYAYTGRDPDGFMTAPEVAEFFAGYATSFSAPVLDHTVVHHVHQDGRGFVVATDSRIFRSSNLVVATAWRDRPAIPAAARQLSPRLHQVRRAPTTTPTTCRLVVCSSSAPRPLAYSFRASSTRAGARSPLRWDHTAECPAGTEGWTPSGGSTRSAPSIERSMTSTTFERPAASPHCNSSDAPTTRPSTCSPCKDLTMLLLPETEFALAQQRLEQIRQQSAQERSIRAARVASRTTRRSRWIRPSPRPHDQSDQQSQEQWLVSAR